MRSRQGVTRELPVFDLTGPSAPALWKVQPEDSFVAVDAVFASMPGGPGESVFPRPPEANLNPHRAGDAPGVSASVQAEGADLNPLRPKVQNRDFLTPRKNPSHSSATHPNPLQAATNAEVVDAHARARETA